MGSAVSFFALRESNRLPLLYSSLLTVHLIGLAIGLGGATIGDLLMLRTVVRRQPHPTMLLRDLSLAIWFGLAILTASGLALFAESPEPLLHNSGFIAKMVVVAVLMLNGVFLHRQLPDFKLSGGTLLAGAISSVSWYGALLLAMFKTRFHLELTDYLGIYVAAVFLVWTGYTKVQSYWLRKESAPPVTQSRVPVA